MFRKVGIVMKLIDSHAHIISERMIGDYENIKARAKAAGVVKVLAMCTNIMEAQKAVEIAEKDPFIDVAVGFHPTDLNDISQQDWQDLEGLLIHPNIVALGEIGLDYHWDNVSKEVQRQGFIRQIELARKYDLPISIHMREAVKDTIDILMEYAPIKGVMHCYSGSVETMYEVLKLGLDISFAGPLTFKNSKEAPQVAHVVPIEKVLIETDSPYLTPHPFRGKPNEPKYVAYIFEKLKEIKEIDNESLSQQIITNYKRIFPKTNL